MVWSAVDCLVLPGLAPVCWWGQCRSLLSESMGIGPWVGGGVEAIDPLKALHKPTALDAFLVLRLQLRKAAEVDSWPKSLRC